MTNKQLKKFMEKYGITQISVAKELKTKRATFGERINKPGSDPEIEAAVKKLTRKKYKNIKDLLAMLED